MPRPRSGTKALAPDAFVTSFPARVDELVSSRQAFSGWLEAHCTDEQARGDLTVVYSELTANAVEATPQESLKVVAKAWCEGSDVVLEVANLTEPGDKDEAEVLDLGDPLRGRGRGLVIVDAFVDELRVAAQDGRHVVRCRLNDADSQEERQGEP